MRDRLASFRSNRSDLQTRPMWSIQRHLFFFVSTAGIKKGPCLSGLVRFYTVLDGGSAPHLYAFLNYNGPCVLTGV